ncbi:MAG: hypothetical protein K5761_01745 [Clostridiales bacterium]|nr:hypothetical protein [Clostridiales bacterium]
MKKAQKENRIPDKKRPIRRLVKFLCVVLICVTAFFLADYILAEIADGNAVYNKEKLTEKEIEEVSSLIKSDKTFSEEDYIRIFEYTGLGQAAVDKLRKEGAEDTILYYGHNFQKESNYLCNRHGVLTYDEYLSDENERLIWSPDFADLQNGDILITLSIHTFGYRHGHAAIVVDADRGLLAHSVRFGVNSRTDSINEYRKYPLVAVLRLKGNSEKTGQEIADYINEHMMDIPYNMLAGTSKEIKGEAPGSTQCAHYLWYAYKKYGFDINSDGGWLVTPTDILESDEFDIVQIYGFDPDAFPKESIITTE